VVCGGGAGPARARGGGVPGPKVKIGLFMGVAFLAWFLGQHLLFNFSSVQAGLGVGNEFIYIIAAVVGGELLTGGSAPRWAQHSVRSSSAWSPRASSSPAGTRTGSR